MTPPPDKVNVLLRERSGATQWTFLLAATLALSAALESLHLPAGFLLGAMTAGILTAMLHGRIAVPKIAYIFAQGFVGLLMARAIQLPMLSELLKQWPLFLACVCAVIFFGIGLGGLLARAHVLPGTTAVWGSAPGAATVMMVMSADFGGDARLVGLMQFLRVVLVALCASIVARIWAPGAVHLATDWFPAQALVPTVETLALACLGALAGARAKIPAGALLLPMFVGIALVSSHVMVIALPPSLLAVSYVVVGWAIGLSFTRETLVQAARLLPRIAASSLALIGLCGALAIVLHLTAGTDALSAYLATSPGGADSVAIIATSTQVDVPFVMAMQTARFLLVLLLGPSLARVVAHWVRASSV